MSNHGSSWHPLNSISNLDSCRGRPSIKHVWNDRLLVTWCLYQSTETLPLMKEGYNIPCSQSDHSGGSIWTILTVPYILTIPCNLHIYIRKGTKLPIQQNLIRPIREKCLLLFTVHLGWSTAECSSQLGHSSVIPQVHLFNTNVNNCTELVYQ